MLSFDVVYEPDVPEAKKIFVYKYLTKNPWGKIIVLHGIGNNHIPYLMWYAKQFSKLGLESYFLIFPYHLNRGKTNWEGGEPFYHHSPAHCIVRFHQAIKDVRRTIDLIEKNNDDIYIMGFSFGGMITTMTMALDKRIKAGIIAFSGGDWRWINWYSPYLEKVRNGYRKYSNEWGCVDEKKCVKLRSNAKKQLTKINNINDIFTLKPTCFHYDPISYAKFVTQPTLLFQGIFDKIIPAKATKSLFESLPNAKKILIPSGHKSSYMFRRIITKMSVNFLKKSKFS
ncbi:alpha/beta hydrolase [Thermosipho melanesiensis]|nr:alpha/beta hydrolase [Thermosipho melanesiensis]OOC37349.1 alpha/beta hydrolase [Thermosipho melanesiensis]OOC38100.1 alpha/beta hydrolase [Thermosipho melanesiensis]OOC41330.1 alpha/beta hydrolase [Thermosipho melanesiensis]OOC43324.1 alpha/beta hydrolase [Thermosipho melanesiensis]